MNFGNLETWISGGAIGALVIALEKAFSKWQEWRKSKTETDIQKDESQSKIDIASNDQAMKIYKENIEFIQTNVDKLTNALNTSLEKEIVCREEKSALCAEIKIRDLKIVWLEEELSKEQKKKKD